MKNLLLLILLLFINFPSCNPSQQSIKPKDEELIDSVFTAQFNDIEKMKCGSLNLYTKPIHSIIFLEEITGISPKSDLSYFGVSYFDLENDLFKWREWYKQNKSLLRWDEKDQRVYKLQGVESR